MKKFLKILLAAALIATLALGIVACGQQSSGGKIVEVIDENAGEYQIDIGTAYGAKPDLDNVIIDGKLDDELWQNKKWYTQYEPSQLIKLMVTTAMSEKGLYIAASADDNYIYWNGYNYFFSNSHFWFQLYSGNNTSIRIDAVSVRVSSKYINARSRVEGKYNSPGNSGGMTAEVFVRWEDLGIDTTDGIPETIKMYAVYNYCLSQGTSTTSMYPTFVKTTGDSGQVTEFGPNGYVNGDEPDAIMGSHKGGQARTNGWTVNNPGEENESVTSDKKATYNFAQAIFYRDLTSSTFRVTTKMRVKEIDKDSRAGILLYRDNINYRAVALNITSDTFFGGKMNRYVLKGYTNYPYNITEISNLKEIPLTVPDDTIELTVYGNSGKLYYIVNGVYAYSEEATYVGINAFAGFYAFNATVEFYDYDYETYGDTVAFDDALAKYAYTINVKNLSKGNVTVTTDQLAISREGNDSLEVTMTFKPGYTIDEIKYTRSAGEVDLMPIASKAKGGIFYLNDIKENIEISASAKTITGDLIDIRANVVNAQTGEKLRSAELTLYGDGPFSRYYKKYVYNADYILNVEKGNIWHYDISASGYRDTTGVMNDGNAINETMTVAEDLAIINSVVGGTAESVLGADGKPMVNYSVASSAGTRWDLSREEEGKVVFQTPDTDKDVIFFSGRTISDFQVAYVEIINRTDPTSFTSFENDPAAGFIIKNAGNESFMGLRKTGLRLKKERNNWQSGTYVDTYDVCNWSGYLGNVDRDNGGRFISAYKGTGTVDRIPYDGQEYTNSFLMIRKGPYYYFYACDGAAGVQPDRTNFNKLQSVGTYYNEATPGYAAIGLTCTVAYNLRMDFENYWILVGEQAEEFAGKLISTPFNITKGGSKVSIESSALVGYEQGEDKLEAGIITGGTVTVTPHDLSDGRILKLSFTDGTARYLTNKYDSFTYTPKAVNGSVSMSVEEVEYVNVSGTVNAPDGITATEFKGELYDASGTHAYEFYSKKDGSFSIKVEKGMKGSIAFLLDGYVMDPAVLPGQTTNALDLYFKEVNIGGSITFADGTNVSTSADGVIRSGSKGELFDYCSDNSGRGQLVVGDANKYTDNFVLTFTYERVAQPTGGAKSEDSDASIGIRFYGDGLELCMMFIGNGYRVYHDGQFAQRHENRGMSPVNMSLKTTPYPYDFKIIKTGDMVYMLAKTYTQTEYTLINTENLIDWMPRSDLGYAIGWYSFGYNDMEVYNVKLEGMNSENATEIYSTVSVKSNDGGTVAVVGETKVLLGGKFTVKAVPEEGKCVKNVTVNGKETAFTVKDGYAEIEAVAEDKNVVVSVTFGEEVYSVTAAVGRSIENAKYIKAVCGDLIVVLKISKTESDLGDTVAYNDGTNFNMLLPYGTGTWTLTFWSDEACTVQLGKAVTVTVNK